MGSIFSLKYQYQSLPDTRSIRLVKLCEQRFSPSVIECTIDTVNLNRCPPFTALSYTWGNPIGWDGIDTTYDPKRGQIHFILLNERPICVTENLYKAICQIRASARRDSYLWIDALCINQEDIDEKSAQVRLMCDIYSSAATVLVWLGEEDAGSDFVDQLGREFFPLLIRLIDEEGGEKVMSHLLEDPNLWWKLKRTPIVGSAWKPLIDFFRRSWFQRAWVIQELALARHVCVFCGSKELSFDLLYAIGICFGIVSHWALSVLAQADDPQLRNISSLPARGLSRVTRQRFMVTNGGPEYPYIASLLHGVCNASDREMKAFCYFDSLLLDIRGSTATDPRDNVYSVLGILQRFHGDADTFMQIDYSAPVSKVYTDSASLLLVNSPTLAHLSQVTDRAQGSVSNLSSWVPDYTLPTRPSFAWTRNGDRPVYDVDLQRAKSVRISWTEQPTLHLEGVWWDAIVELGEGMTQIIREKRFFDCARICLGLEGTYINNQSISEAFWRCLIGDTSFDGNPAGISPASEKCAEYFRKLMLTSSASVISQAEEEPGVTALDNFKKTVDTIKEQFSPHFDPQSLFPTWSEIMDFKRSIDAIYGNVNQQRVERNGHSNGEPKPFDVSSVAKMSESAREDIRRRREFDTMVGHASQGRRLFRTKRNLLGICPYSSAVGDSVWFLAGAKVPFVLRPVADTKYHELLGECYLHGFMHGEINQFGKLDFQEVSII